MLSVQSHMRVVAAALLLAVGASATAAEIGRIKVSKGAVFIERGGTRMAAPIDTIVEPADVLVTGADGSAGVTFTDNTRIAVGPSSVLAISRYAYDQSTQAGTF